MHKEIKPASRNSCEWHGLPSEKFKLNYSQQFNDYELDQLKVGYIPVSDGDHWFIFFEDDWLYIVSLPQGVCEFWLRLERAPECIEVVEAWCSSSPDLQKLSGYNEAMVSYLDTILRMLIVREHWFFDITVIHDNAEACIGSAIRSYWKENYFYTLEHLNKTILLDPNKAYALCMRASLCATCPDDKFQNGRAAVLDATKAITVVKENGGFINEGETRKYFQTLAAAHAEAGDFDIAVEVLLNLLESCSLNISRKEINVLLELFEQRQAFREAGGTIFRTRSKQ